MKRIQLFNMLLLPAMLLLAASCKKEIKTETQASGASQEMSVTNANASRASGAAEMRAAETELLKSVRQATARFHATAQAIKAGYVADDHCVSVPGLGGMGYHWANPSLVDPVFDPLKPEVVLYATGPGGQLHLVALEYVVINVGQARPMFGDHPFDINGSPVPVPHWTLHVWLYEHNPSGMFMPFNPNISCP